MFKIVFFCVWIDVNYIVSYRIKPYVQCTRIALGNYNKNDQKYLTATIFS